MHTLDRLLHRLTGIAGIRAYGYQRRVAEAILAGRNVVLSAPTGAGKTWAVLLPFLLSWLEGSPVADRLLYAVPLRSLASNLVASTKSACSNLTHNPTLTVRVQTGEQPEDPHFEGDICFTTIDQLLSSYLTIPVSLGPRLANLNAGALVGALVVFDEVHMLDPERSLATVLELADRLKPYTQLILMTATLSPAAASLFAAHLGAEFITVAEEELHQMPSHRDKQRSYRWMGKPLTGEDVTEAHRRLLQDTPMARTLVVVNTVGRAQDVYGEVVGALGGTGTAVYLLHSRFTKADRAKKEQILAPYFGPKAGKGNVILISTQVVEAGIDISADEIHTELCPANALVQRAGRCARYPAPRNWGTVYVYELLQASQGQYRLGPYRDEPWRTALSATRSQLAELTEGRLLGNQDESALVEAAHGPTEVQTTAAILRGLDARRKQIDQVLDQGDRGAVGDLIRDVDAVAVLVHGDPRAIDLELRPYLISVPREALHSLRALERDGTVLGWMPLTGEADDFAWQPVYRVDPMMPAWLLVLSPAVASYTAEEGLRLGVPGKAQTIGYHGRSTREPFSYQCETYQDHVRRVLDACRGMAGRYQVGAAKLAAAFKVGPEEIHRLAECACALHDAGKLLQAWQARAREWQQRRDPAAPAFLSGEPLAHTTSDGTRPEDRRFKIGIPHAGEGALGFAIPLRDRLAEEADDMERAMDWVQVVATAVACHHTGRLKQVDDSQRFLPGALAHVNRSLAALALPLQLDTWMETLDATWLEQVLISAGSAGALLPLYWHVVRRLRLADWASQKSGVRKG